MPSVRPPLVLGSWWSDVLQGTDGAPWLWWLAALVVIVGLLLLGMRMLGLFPE